MFDFLAVSANIMGAYLFDFAAFLASQTSRIYRFFFSTSSTLCLNFSSAFTILSNLTFSGLSSKSPVLSKSVRFLGDGSAVVVAKTSN